MNIRFILLALALVVGFTQGADAQPCQNYALQFDGINDAVAIDGFPASSERTVEFWIYWNPSPSDPNYYGILSSLDDADYYGYRACIKDFGDGNGPSPAISFELEWGLRIWLSLGSYGQWHHIAIATTELETRYFIDGQGYDDDEGYFIGVSDPETPPSNMVIGAGAGAEYFNGMLDEIKVWNYARSAAEIRHELNRHLTTSDGSPGAYYPFDEGRGTRTSWGSNTGTLLGGVAWVESDLEMEYYDCCSYPLVTTQPVSEIVYVGDDATFTAGSDNADDTIQWQFSDNGGADWYDVVGATSTTNTIPDVTMLLHGYRYRAAFTNDCGTTYSDEAVLTVRIAVTDLGPVDIYVGTSSNSNNGKKIDLLVELFKNGDLITSGEVLNQRVLGSASSDHSKKYSVALSSLPASLAFDGDDIFSCRISVRRSSSADFDVNLWYNGDASGEGGGLKAGSRIHKASGYYYLRSGDELSQSAGSSATSLSQTASSAYQEIDEWSMSGTALKSGRGASSTLSPNEFSAQLTPNGKVSITGSGTVALALYDITGRKVQSYSPTELPSSGKYEMILDHNGLPAGIYVLTVSAGAEVKALQYRVTQ